MILQQTSKLRACDIIPIAEKSWSILQTARLIWMYRIFVYSVPRCQLCVKEQASWRRKDMTSLRYLVPNINRLGTLLQLWVQNCPVVRKYARFVLISIIRYYLRMHEAAPTMMMMMIVVRRVQSRSRDKTQQHHATSTCDTLRVQQAANQPIKGIIWRSQSKCSVNEWSFPAANF